MTTRTALPRKRIVAVLIALVLVLGVALAAFAVSRGGAASTGSPLDPGLKSTATSFLAQLNRASPRLPVVDSSLNSFKAWVYDVQPVFARLARHPGKQFEQVEFVDPNPFPPQAVTIMSPGHTAIYPPSTVSGGVLHSGQPTYATVQIAGKSYRMYIALLPAPDVLKQVGVYAVFEVLQAQ